MLRKSVYEKHFVGKNVLGCDKEKMKTKIVVLVGIALCAMLLISPALASDAGTLEIYGNANEDDTIDMRDLTYVKLIFFGKKPETELADAKYDGKINPLDFIQIKLIIVGKEKEITVSQYIGSPAVIADRTVTINKPVKRIIMLDKYGIDAIRMFGEQDKVVGVASEITESKYSYLPELSKSPSVGKSSTPDVEEILSLNPDLVITWRSLGHNVEKLDEQLPDSIPVVGFDFWRASALKEEMMKLGYILGIKDKAEYYNNNFHDKYICLVKARTEGLSEGERPKVYKEYKEYYTYGGTSSAQEMIELAGGKNTFADIPKSTFNVDREEVVMRNPDIIFRSALYIDAGYDVDDISEMKALRDSILGLSELANVNAVKNGRVYIVDPTLSYGLHYPIHIAYLAKWFQPNLFDDLDPKEIHREYLTEFLLLDYDLDKHGVFVYHPEEHPDGK